MLVVSSMLLFAAFRVGAQWFGQTTTVIVLPHAETPTQGPDPALSPEGMARATRLASLLRDSGVTAIYVSDTRRARETAEPLARRLGVQLVEYPGRKIDELAGSILDRHRGQTVLVVGHSNTVPPLLATLSRGRYTKRLADDEFDGLYFVTVNPETKETKFTSSYQKFLKYKQELRDYLEAKKAQQAASPSASPTEQ